MFEPPFGQLGPLFGTPLILSATLLDGEMLLVDAIFGGQFVLGTRARTPIEQARLDALRMVRVGLADALAYIGEPPWSEPATHEQVLAGLRGAD
jgi:hypothetical protein